MSALDDFDAAPPQQAMFDATDRIKLPHNDVGNARRLLMAHGAEMRFVPGRGWMVWTGEVWDLDFGETAALTRASTLQDLLLAEAAAASARPVPQAEIDAMVAAKACSAEDAEKTIRANRVATVRKFATSCGNRARIGSALDLLRDSCRATVTDLDPCPDRATALNGELDLEALAAERPEAEDEEERLARLGAALGPYRRESLSTRRLGARWRPEATCPDWRRFMALAQPDEAMRAYAQRVAGYLLFGRNGAQACMILLGPGGNGKSTFANAVAHVMGSYAATCRIEMFIESRQATQGPTPEEAVLPGARVYIASEPEVGAVLSTSKVKGLTGGERRLAHAKGRDPFTWLPNGTPLLSFNRVPKISDESEGLWRRLFFVPFDVRLHELPVEQRVPHERMERMIEAEADGILAWMVEGWIAYRAIGLAPPPAALELKARQRALADPVGEFMGEMVVEEAARQIQASDLHRVYEAWCEGMGVAALSAVKFKRMLVDKGHLSRKSGGLMWWRGLAWRDEAAPPFEAGDEAWEIELAARVAVGELRRKADQSGRLGEG